MAPADPAQPLLHVDNVSVRLGGLQILDDVGFDIMPGEAVGLIGPNGAGKTTVFNVVCGFVRPDRGSLTWDGTPLRRHRPHQLAGMGIARTLQGLGLFEHQTALANVMIGASGRQRAGLASALLGWPPNDRRRRQTADRAVAMLDTLGVADVAHRPAGSLPYGLRKRVTLARALMADPRLLLLDEPAAGLSLDEIAELADLIRSPPGHPAVMLVEHHMDLVMSVCDRVYVLDFGRVIADGTPDEVRADPAVQDAYLGEAAVVGDA